MRLFLSLVVFFAASAAFADGWNCQTHDGSLNIKVYNNTQPNDGTRNAAIMIISDPNVQEGRKTIATFKRTKGTLSSDGANYTAIVDHRYTGSRRKGELIAGTKIGYLKSINMQLDFWYSHPVVGGELVQGHLTFEKRNGQKLYDKVECERYLKGQ